MIHPPLITPPLQLCRTKLFRTDESCEAATGRNNTHEGTPREALINSMNGVYESKITNTCVSNLEAHIHSSRVNQRFPRAGMPWGGLSLLLSLATQRKKQASGSSPVITA